MSVSKIIKQGEITRAVRVIRAHLKQVHYEVDRGNIKGAYAAAERVQMAAFNLKSYISDADPSLIHEDEAESRIRKDAGYLGVDGILPNEVD